MKALVYHGPGSRSWDDVPDPELTSATDIVMRVDAATICGTDLHILKGDVPEVEPGTILGHEAVGTIVATGEAVTTLQEGDRVLASCITSCGRCPFCRSGRYGLCTGGGGWILERLWIKDVTITTGLVDTFTTPRLMQLVAAGKLDPSVFATHRFSLDEAMDAYDAFADAKGSGRSRWCSKARSSRRTGRSSPPARERKDDRPQWRP